MLNKCPKLLVPSCWPTRVLRTVVSTNKEQGWIWRTTMIQDQQVSRTISANKWFLSTCLLLFRLLALVEIKLFFFFLLFFWYFFFSARSTKIGTPQSISSIRCKVWSVENHERFTKPILELGNSNRSPSEFFLNFLISVWLAKPVNPMCKNSIAFREKKERLNRSSERKVMPVLRRTLRCRVLWRSRWNRVGRKRWDDGSGVWITQPN